MAGLGVDDTGGMGPIGAWAIGMVVTGTGVTGTFITGTAAGIIELILAK